VARLSPEQLKGIVAAFKAKGYNAHAQALSNKATNAAKSPAELAKYKAVADKARESLGGLLILRIKLETEMISLGFSPPPLVPPSSGL
jgi:hypothetical protein